MSQQILRRQSFFPFFFPSFFPFIFTSFSPSFFSSLVPAPFLPPCASCSRFSISAPVLQTGPCSSHRRVPRLVPVLCLCLCLSLCLLLSLALLLSAPSPVLAAGGDRATAETAGSAETGARHADGAEVSAGTADGQGISQGADEAFIAPGYPLAQGDRRYAGYGTLPNAPVLDMADLFPEEAVTQGAGTSTGRERNAEPAAELQELLDVRGTADTKPKDRVKTLRARMLTEAAGTVAFQKGVRRTYADLLAACHKRALALDRIFGFQALLLQGRVLPPVLRWIDAATTLESPDTARSVEAAYRIEQPARLVSRAPSWRDYLEQEFEAFEPGKELLPRTSEEVALWQEGVRRGWAEGCEQGRQLFALNLARLVADFRGMLRFNELAQQGMISLPGLSKGKLGIRVGNRSLHMNETVFRITVPAAFLPPEAWSKNRHQN